MGCEAGENVGFTEGSRRMSINIELCKSLTDEELISVVGGTLETTPMEKLLSERLTLAVDYIDDLRDELGYKDI